ncbi:uncharacterized protein LOC110716470 [Chenopodium quinoa]|uniref:uncharacterized protein LOC110716470 n=1 Tax=Chenopodium quinoa TaxID=63459 RepID=UPI000B788299|nr:uncharacterized protein LOC110716470 [Chenopodium quinoa]
MGDLIISAIIRQSRQPLHPQHRLKHSLHPQHQLIFNTIVDVRCGVIFRCDACNKKAEAFMYSCTECNFDLHKECALQVGSCTITNDNMICGTGNPTAAVDSSLQTVIRHSLHPQHQLEYSSLGGKIGYYTYWCNACLKKDEGLRYCCKECNFDLHKECAAAVPVGSSSMILQASARKDNMTEDDDDDVPYPKISKRALIKRVKDQLMEGGKDQLMEEVKDKFKELLYEEDTTWEVVSNILQIFFM